MSIVSVPLVLRLDVIAIIIPTTPLVSVRISVIAGISSPLSRRNDRRGQPSRQLSPDTVARIGFIDESPFSDVGGIGLPKLAKSDPRHDQR